VWGLTRRVIPARLAARWTIRFAVLGEQPDPGPPRLPVVAQHDEQLRRQLHHPVLVPLAESDVNQHPGTVDVAGLERQRLGDAQPRGIQRHQQCLVLGVVVDHIKQPPQLIPREHRRQPPGGPGARQLLKPLIPSQRYLIEELQAAARDVVPAPAHVLVLHQMQQVLPHLLARQLLR
jgi:hypothetical protein